MSTERGMFGRLAGWMISIALLSGCCTSREEQLANVAKDWCLSIRASQVIPVYPLTEDLQPGDVFLVQRTVLDQAEQYSSRGYLPLDQLVARLGHLDYARFYGDAYWKGDYKAVPHPRLEASTPIAGAQIAKKAGGAQGNGGNQGGGGGQGNGNGANENDTADKSSVGTRFPNALVPRASFPSYDFETKRGAGVNLAVPVYGVPVGLSLMGTDQATGSITITDAFTYGIDIESLYARLKAWSRKNFSKELARIAQTTARPLYLRVVSRVYLTGAVTVALTNQASQSGGLDVGIAKEVTLEGQPPRQEDSNSGNPKTPKANTGGQEEKPKPEEKNDGKTVQERYADALGMINKALNQGGPGGSLRVAAASRRSVTMREDFVHPLVIGYLGFDVQIMEDGEIGPLIATLDVLDHKVLPDVPPSKAGSRSRTLTLAEYSSMFARIKEASTGSPKVADLIKRLNEMKEFVPPKFPVNLWEETEQGGLTKGKAKDAETSKTEDFRRLTTYAGQLNESIAVLNKHQAELTDEQRAERKQTEEELERIQGILNFHPAVNELVNLNASMK